MTSDDDGVECIQLAGGGMSATVLTLGAALFDLQVPMPSAPRSVVLRNDRPRDYRDNPHYLGAIAGRCANRIRGGQCEIEGKTYRLDCNERGITHLHGGRDGFSRRIWTVTERGATSVELALLSQDGDQGYPGNVAAKCLYEVLPDCGLRLTLIATTDRTTLVNLAGHAYFNLEQESSILDHRLQIEAAHYLPVDNDLIPDGRILPVAGSCFDFRTPKVIGSERDQSPIGYDHNFVVASSQTAMPSKVATLVAPSGQLAMELWTTEPGLQFYDGQKLSGQGSAGAQRLRPFAGCCLEPQRFPDSVHHPHFAQSLLRPGEEYRQISEYRFRQLADL